MFQGSILVLMNAGLRLADFYRQFLKTFLNTDFAADSSFLLIVLCG